MANDPSKTEQDWETVSRQEHEVNYFKEKFRDEFPDIERGALEEAIGEVKRRSKDPDVVESKVREILRLTQR